MEDNTQNELGKEDSGIKEVKFREMPKRDKLQEVIPFLFYYEPFFADVFRYINKTKSLELPIAGVRVTSEAEVELLYNPITFNSMNLSEIYFIISIFDCNIFNYWTLIPFFTRKQIRAMRR